MVKKVDKVYYSDKLVPFNEMIDVVDSIKENHGSFEAILFITDQMGLIDGVQKVYLEGNRIHSLVYVNPATKTAFLYLLAKNNGNFSKYLKIFIF